MTSSNCGIDTPNPSTSLGGEKSNDPYNISCVPITLNSGKLSAFMMSSYSSEISLTNSLDVLSQRHVAVRLR